MQNEGENCNTQQQGKNTTSNKIQIHAEGGIGLSVVEANELFVSLNGLKMYKTTSMVKAMVKNGGTKWACITPGVWLQKQLQ